MQYSKGFTLIEMLVTASLIIIITSATLLNFNSLGGAFDLDREVQSVAQDIKNAISMTMALEENPNVQEGEVIAYGINFVVDNDTNDTYTREVYFIDSSANIRSIDLELVKLEKSEILFLNSNSNDNKNIIFYPPHPKTFIGGINLIGGEPTSPNSEITITIALKDNSANTRTININKYGRVEIQ